MPGMGYGTEGLREGGFGETGGDVEDPFDGFERLDPEWPQDGRPGRDAGSATERGA